MISADEEDVELLRTVPGVGLVTASIIRAYVDDIDRYDSPKDEYHHLHDVEI